ncbi:filamentous hemagglutinin family protein (plasmid) [Cupriavidus basilensis]|uniref:Filamentous hemagglutinin family protein n=2 Tax=Cupriavidus basilensis TaxID=68895 RepID=A0A643FZA4_9BURK|nr:filamentous hemagglutinin family protein [Cupriavidus basilensis]
MVVNRNGIIFNGSSQVDTRNLVAAAANISNDQFQKNGIYGPNATTPSFTDALGKVQVQAGARITAREPSRVTDGGGYVMLLGSEVNNAGAITTHRGQTQLAAGDSFIIRKGAGTEGNTASTTRGNEIAPQFAADSMAGKVGNTGLILAREGDITLAGRDVRQDGVAVASTTVNTRGTIHLLNSASDKQGKVTLGQGATTAILIEDDGTARALDSQRDALIKDSADQDKVRAQMAAGAFDNLARLPDRRDQSRIEIVSGGDVLLDGNSLTLATGGQIAVSAARRSFLADRAQLDVSGAVGVSLAMEANNVKINVQGNEQRDAPGNRDSGNLLNANVWIDRRRLTYVPAGTGGYAGERWYTAGGLLEVGGYLNNQGHGIGEWAAQGGTIVLGGKEVVTQAGSSVNLSGGSLNVQTGYLNQTWLKGSDGRLYNVNSAPADIVFTGVYKGFESEHARWGKNTTEYYHTPLIAPQRLLENGYTVGRDAGQLIVSAPTAVLEGDIVATVFNGAQQTRAASAGVTDAYKQSQSAVARAGSLALGQYGALGRTNAFSSDVKIGNIDSITSNMAVTDALEATRLSTVWLDAARLNGQQLGGLDLATRGQVAVDAPLVLANGGRLSITSTVTSINADITARGGQVAVGNLFQASSPEVLLTPDGHAGVTLAAGRTIDARGLWTNAQQGPADLSRLAYLDGGSVTLGSTQDVTLSAGSLIDVSSGAAILANGKIKGGKGGDVKLSADDGGNGAGTLTLSGDIRGYGVNGGGTLTIGAGPAIAIGGTVLETNGTLGVGEAAVVNLVTTEAFTVKAGDVLPITYQYAKTVSLPGEAVGGAPNFSESHPVVLAQDWTPPPATSNFYGLMVDGVYTPVYPWSQPSFGAGSVITAIYSPSEFPASYVVPASIFPNGIPIQPVQVVIAAGKIAPKDATFAAGTQLAAGTRLPQAVKVQPVQYLDTSLFQKGFSSYSIDGHQSLAVTAGTKIDAAMPVYRLSAAASGVTTGADPSAVFEIWTPPLYQDDPVAGKLAQRAGADVALKSNAAMVGGVGNVNIGTGASITVDPGRRIAVESPGQITIDGRLQAAGGAIDVIQANTAAGENAPAGSTPGQRSILIGEHAVLDVAARAVTAVDREGLRYGIAPDGGSITIGAPTRRENGDGIAQAAEAFIVIRPGAVLDASGTSTMIDLPTGSTPGGQSRPLALASNGGTIALNSFNGLYLDGTMTAAAGGAGARGGTLTLTLETARYQSSNTIPLIPDDVRFVRELVIGQDYVASGSDEPLRIGTARISAEQIKAGGFDSLSAYADIVRFDGNVDLALGRNIELYHSALVTDGSAVSVRLAAPHVAFREAPGKPITGSSVYPKAQGNLLAITPSARVGSAKLLVDADLIDIHALQLGGAAGSVPLQGGSRVFDYAGFDGATLNSRGDIRMIGNLVGSRTLDLNASQIYPVSSANGTISSPGSIIMARDAVRMGRTGDALPALPGSVFGGLIIYAREIEQGGVLRAPLGSITLGTTSSSGTLKPPVTEKVDLLPGSITSVSANGLVLPYGGTVDGITYSHGGNALSGSLNFNAGVTLAGKAFDVRQGATIDLSGGGELLGSGFVSGRGGSVDVLTTPLANAGPGYGFSAAGNKVYAIVPGAQPGVAPIDASAGAAPGVGRQITVPAGVPGLPAGTYTLMPARYALLPGAYRVEVGGQAALSTAGVAAMSAGNGSWLVSGYQGIANTSYRDAQPTQLMVTPGQTVRAHSQYNETSYANFLIADAARSGALRPILPVDAKSLILSYAEQPGAGPALSFKGHALYTPGRGGYGGMLSVATTGSGSIEIKSSGAPSAADRISLSADDLNAVGADRMMIGNVVQFQNTITLFGGAKGIVVRNGVVLEAPEIFLAAGVDGVTVEDGARISTLGRGSATPFPTADGYRYFANRATGALILSNGFVDLVSQASDTSSSITVGKAELYTEGTLGFVVSAAGKLVLDPEARYGARYLSVAAPSINIGQQAAIDAAAAAHVLPDGLTLNQQVFDGLLRGNAGIGIPKLETLILSAGGSVNFLGPASFNTIDPATGRSSLAELVLSTPAIYGLGAVGDKATLTTGTLFWNGVSDGKARDSMSQPGSLPPPKVVAGGPGTGAGTLDLVADEIVFGYPRFTQPDTQLTLDRLALGFATVNLNARQRITANNRNTLAVYQSGTDAASYAGGNLNLVTPLLTGAAASINRYTAGGALTVSAPAGTAAASTGVLGAEIGLKGRTVTLDSVVSLPSGKLTVEADGDIRLGDTAHIDLAGREVSFFDVRKYSWGGDLILSSAHGNIAQASGSVIDLSAKNNRGGSLSAAATDAAAGDVTLAGAILGAASGTHDAGGTLVPYPGATIDVRAQAIGDFARLNQRLNGNGVLGGRSFQLKREGLNLVVGDEIKANSINVSVDGGSLTVNGRVDASGPQVGTIRLAARDGLTLTSNAVLDAHGTQLRVDSYGQPIDAPNRAIVDLTAGKNPVTGLPGWLRIASGATIDVRAADGVARGTVSLNAPRLDGSDGDIAVDAAGPVFIDGAKSVAVNGFRRYIDAPPGTPSADGRPVQVITQAYLDGIDADSRAFIGAAWSNAGLQGRLAGLRAYGAAYHLRPGVEIASAMANGSLVVDGDLDFSGYRYGPGADPFTRGSGEPGVLTLRAGGDLTIKGSINDGFAPPPETADDYGWVVSLRVRPGETLPSPLLTREAKTIEIDYVVPDGGVIVDITENDYYDPGMTVPRGTVTSYISIGAGSPSPITISSSGPRPEPGRLWAVSPMLPAGSQSWSMRLASGADVTSVDTRALQATRTGNLVLDDEHFSGPTKTAKAISVVRTGTGDLDLLAGGDVSMKSLFGVYTAGTQSVPVLAADGSNPYNQPRGRQPDGSGASVLGPDGSGYESLVAGSSSLYQAWYPENGGNLLLTAQGKLTGLTVFNSSNADSLLPSNATGNWLWRQGAEISGLPTAWWVNFGTYVLPLNGSGVPLPSYAGGEPRLVGFTGFGALGGGNVAIRTGGDAGVIDGMGDDIKPVSQGLTVAAGGTGRVTADGRLIQSGGGDVSIRIGGALNPLDPNVNPSKYGVSTLVRGNTLAANLNGVLTNVRGAIEVSAGSIGRIDLGYGMSAPSYTADPRAPDPNVANGGRSNGGPLVLAGDTAVSFTSRGDLVLSSAEDPGRTAQQNTTPYSITSNGVTIPYKGGGYSWFTLWTDRTAVDLFAAGGNLTPTTVGVNINDNRQGGDYPSILRAAAAEGSIYYGAKFYENGYVTSLALAPSPRGQLEILARNSIQTLGMPINMSGAGMGVLPTPFKAAFMGPTGVGGALFTNISVDGGGLDYGLPLYAFGPNTVTGILHAGDYEPQRFYAVDGDIIGLRTGEVLDFTNSGKQVSNKPVNQWNVAAKPVWIMAGRDIVGAGAQPDHYTDGKPFYANGNYGAASSGNLIYHPDATDVSLVRAGRDILQANFQVAGPGTLEISAGRNFYQGDKGSIASIGPLASGDSRPGASIVAMAGVGSNGPDYAALKRYLDPANRLPAATPLDGSGKVARTYEGELAAWLRERYGYAGTGAEALAYFNALAPEQQSVFLREVYYAELKAGGREYNDPDSRRYGSYLRGRNAIAALFPERDAQGGKIARTGDITMFGGSGIRTLFGGDIQMLAPAGQIVAGVQGTVPPASSGIVTQGAGDIELYSKGSVLLGLSRIMTTFGGSILAWSAEGDINAGRGSKTTVVYTPPKRVYDDYGNVKLSSQTPSSGAGIATLAPIADVPAGDVDLYAPLGTIDAGEAGIRFSGNINLAALQIVNAANIVGQGKATGLPTIAAVNVGALTNASSAAAQAATAAQDATQRDRAAARQNLPSIFTVRVLGFGNEQSPPTEGEQSNVPPRSGQLGHIPYDATSPVQFVGVGGDFDVRQVARLTAEQRRQLQQDR